MFGMNLLFAAMSVICIMYYLAYGLLGFKMFSKEEHTFNERLIYSAKTIQLLYFSNIVAILFMIFAVISSTSTLIVPIVLVSIDMLMIVVSMFLSKDLFRIVK